MSKAKGASNNDSCDLIVDFPYRRRQTSVSVLGTGGEMEMAAAKTTRTTKVRFSDDTAIHRFQYPSREEISKRWHCKGDKLIFTQEMTRDVRHIRYLLSTTPMEAVDKEILYVCVGLEALLTSKVTRFLKEKKRVHTRSIVEMQHFLSDEQLAAYAMSHSSQSRERAQKLAYGYLEILA